MHSSPETYTPCYEGVIAGYVVNYLKKNYWRVARTMEWQDALQEAQVVFLRCAERYPAMDTPQHFVALFKTSWARHFADLSNEDTSRRVEVQGMPFGRRMADEHLEGFDVEVMGDTDNSGALSVALRQAPREVSLVLQLFLSAPQELLDLALAGWRDQDKRLKAGGSARVCRLLGLPEDRDVIKETIDYLSP